MAAFYVAYSVIICQQTSFASEVQAIKKVYLSHSYTREKHHNWRYHIQAQIPFLNECTVS